MSYYSRTALRELKKRYLNILKKCFLANLMAFSFILPLRAETAESTLTPSGELETVVKDSSNFSATTISTDTTIDLAGKNLTYSGITSSSNGGVFFVVPGRNLEFINSDETTDPLLLFENNKASQGGVIYNYYFGGITFDTETSFLNNTGRVIYNYVYNPNNATITFNKDATFSGNTSSASGGVICNQANVPSANAIITFDGDATFTGNRTSSSGGVIYNYAYNPNSPATSSPSTNTTITFNKDVSFSGNTASSYGGVIYNYANNSLSNPTITFNGDVSFSGNTASSNGGAIYNAGSNATITFGEGSILTFENNTVKGELNDIHNNSGTINILGTVNSDIHLTSSGGTIGLKAKDTFKKDDNGNLKYTGSYNLTNNATLDVSGDGAKEITIENLTISGGTLKWDAELTSNGVVYDVINTTATGKFNKGALNIIGGEKDKWFDISLTENQSLLKDDATISVVIDSGLYKTKETETGFAINFPDVISQQTLGEVLRSTTASTFDLSGIFVGEGETLNYIITEKDLSNGSMGEIGTGKKTIIGANNKASGTIINANSTSKLFSLGNGDELTLSDLTIANAKIAIYNYNNSSGKVALNNVNFTNNMAGTGGAIYNYTNNSGSNATITFDGDAAFSGNSASSSGGAIYNYTNSSNSNAIITFNKDASFTGNSASGSSAFGGAIYNNGLITFDGDVSFSGNTASSSGGAIDNYGLITFGESSIVSFSNNTAKGKPNDIHNSNGAINIWGTVNSDIHLTSYAGTVGLKAKDTFKKDDNGNLKYTGSYNLTNNATLDVSGDGAKEITIENLTISGGTLKWDAELTSNGVVYDVINTTATGKFNKGALNIIGGEKDKWFDISLTENQSLLKDDATISVAIDSELYKIKETETGVAINFPDVISQQTLGEMLRSSTASTFDWSGISVGEGETLNYMITEKDLSNGSMGELGSGEKTIIGATEKAEDTIINANGLEQVFNLGEEDQLKLENLTIANAKIAIYNLAGMVELNNVTFENNTSSSSAGAIYNRASITFGEDAIFTKNTASGSSVAGGAIYNYTSNSNTNTNTTITFGGDVSFTDNSVTATGSGGNAYGGAIYNYAYNDDTSTNVNATITFSKDATFSGNSAIAKGFVGNAYGGVIYNYVYNSDAIITFDGEGSFSGNLITNSEDVYGGVIYNYAQDTIRTHDSNVSITFNKDATFSGNSITDSAEAYGGVIYNYAYFSNNGGSHSHAIITFNKDVTFSDNVITISKIAYGGVIYNYVNDRDDYSNTTITFGGDATFTDNTLSGLAGYGGAIYNYSAPITFGGDATFTGNLVTATGDGDDASGGAIYNTGYNATITFGGDATFTDNSAISSSGNAYGGAIENYRGTITFGEGSTVTFTGNTLSGYAGIGGAIHNTGSITFGGDATFTDNSVTATGDGEDAYGGAIYNSFDTIIFNGDATFKENSVTATDDEEDAYGGAIYNGSLITFGGDATFAGNTAVVGGAIYNSNWIGITFGGDATFTDNSVTATDYHSCGYFSTCYNSATGGAIYNNEGTVTFNGDATFTGNSATVTSTEGKAYGGAIYNYADIYNATITFNDVATFSGNSATATGSKGIAYGGAIYNDGNDATITFGENSTLSFSNNTANGELNDIYNNSGTINILGTIASDIHLISSGGIIGLKAKDTVKKDDNGNLKYTGSYALTNTTLDISGDGLKEITIENLTGSGSALKFDVLLKQAEDGTITLEGDKVISDSDYTFTDVYLGIIENIVLNQPGDMTPTIDQRTVTVLGGNAKFADGMSSSSYALTTSPYIYEMMASGQDLTVSASKLAEGITSMQYLTTYAGDSTLKMTGDETGSSYNMGASEDLGSMAVGKKQILGAFDDASKSVITAEGNKMFTLENEGTEFIVKDLTISGAKEVINNQAGTVSLENVVIADSTVDVAIQNEATLNLKDVTVDKGIYNDGSIMAEGKISLGALEGTGILTMNDATLDVMEQFATTNKVVSNNMKIGEEVKEISFNELEIMAGTTLDIDNKHVTAGKVTFGEESTLSVTLNHLKDYGTLTHEEVIGDGDAKLTLKLTEGVNQEEGIYQVFNKDNNLVLEENKLIDVIDMQDGSYKVAKKSVEDLSKELGATKEESTIANALLSGNAEKEEFVQVQTELLDALQSENSATFARAKQALNALGGRSTSLYQSQATAGFTQLHNVISQMLMNTAAPVFGHAGGEEPSRASVYVKGLYDRVNSLTGDGFRMRSKGAVLGVQSAVTEDLTVGVGYAGIDTTAKEPLRRTEVKTNTGFISAQYQPNNWWVSGVVTYSRSQYDEEKHILSSTGTANYDVDSVGAQITTGYNIKKGKVILTPEVGIRYLNAKQEGYQDSLGTTVQGTNSDFVTTMAGFKVGADLGWVRPLAGVMVGYDVITDDVSSVNTLANGATYTIKGKALDRLSTTVVAGFGMDLGENATLKLEYNGNYRKEYLDHSGMLRLEWKF